MSHIHGMDRGCAVLEETISESSSAGAQVDALTGVDRNGEMLQSVFELVAASGNIPIPAEQLDGVTVADPITRFLCGVSVDSDLSGHDGSLGLRTRFAKTAVHQGLIDASLQVSWESACAGRLRQSPIAERMLPILKNLLKTIGLKTAACARVGRVACLEVVGYGRLFGVQACKAFIATTVRRKTC